MPHMVVFRTSEGKPGYRMSDSLDDAVRFVEHLRNNESVTDAKVFRMHEVPLEFKVMYKVEVGGATGSAAASDDDGASAVMEDVLSAGAAGGTGTARTEGRPADLLTDSTQAGGRFGLFSRG